MYIVSFTAVIELWYFMPQVIIITLIIKKQPHGVQRKRKHSTLLVPSYRMRTNVMVMVVKVRLGSNIMVQFCQ